jgi:hypothetical protein
MEEVMQQIATFDIAFDDGIAIDGKIQGLGGKLRARVSGIWQSLQQVLPAPIDGTRADFEARKTDRALTKDTVLIALSIL